MDPRDTHGLNLTRREFFGRTATGIGTVALADLLRRDGLAAPEHNAVCSLPSGIGGLPALPHFAPRAKHVIYLFQNGAPTHVDLFDWKPKLQQMHGQPVPEEYVGGKRFSSMTGNPQGKLMLAPSNRSPSMANRPPG